MPFWDSFRQVAYFLPMFAFLERLADAMYSISNNFTRVVTGSLLGLGASHLVFLFVKKPEIEVVLVVLAYLLLAIATNIFGKRLQKTR